MILTAVHTHRALLVIAQYPISSNDSPCPHDFEGSGLPLLGRTPFFGAERPLQGTLGGDDLLRFRAGQAQGVDDRIRGRDARVRDLSTSAQTARSPWQHTSLQAAPLGRQLLHRARHLGWLISSVPHLRLCLFASLPKSTS